MGTSHSKGKAMKGTVDGKSAEFTFTTTPDGPRLKYKLKDTGVKDTIEKDCLIGTISSKANNANSHIILYVDRPEEADSKKKSVVVPHYKSITATGLPKEFVDFSKANFLESLQKEHKQNASKDAKEPNIHIVISTLSGIGLAAPFYREIIKHILTAANLTEGTDFLTHFTKSAKTVTELATETWLPRANAGVAQKIILLSGDGGMLDTINSLLSAPHSSSYNPPVIVLLPMGTGNALAHSSTQTTDHTLGLSTLAQGNPRPLPLIKTRFSPGARLLVDEATREEELSPDADGTPILFGAVVASWGFHATLVADSDTAAYRKHGVERFGIAAKAALFPSDGSPPHVYRGRVSVLDSAGTWKEMERTEHAYVLATLVAKLEKTFTVSPASKPLEGALRLVHFGPMDGEEVMRVMGLAYQGGKHVEDERVGYQECEGVRVDFEEDGENGRWRRVCVDGKIVRVERGGWVEILREGRRCVELVAR
ncbi:hypothetical protein M501DRAFT_994052 [Patellaria atrata CBS 101060]|uniref:DAGKc domain-containing protein n=1 Tax=Patellaria atrata CBS 101060 TaxID=1346257 RepID=A0A9P4VWX9_9PEZI|nr:hypothetical protein M501DRAFT_994052 [Patellaria atrata CBS 101060]